MSANQLFAQPATEKPKRPFFEPGWYPDLSNEEYHKSFGYSSSSLKFLNEKTMAHLLYQQSVASQETEALVKGQVLHCLTLEPHLFDQEFAVKPEGLTKPSIRQINAKKPSDASILQIAAWNKWIEELGDRTSVPAEMLDSAKAMAKRIREHPKAGPIVTFEETVAEQSIFYWYNPEDWDENHDYRIMCKVRPDLILPGHDVLFDLKSTRDASYSEFMKQALKLGYHISGAMYLDGANRCKEFLRHCGVVAFTRFVWIVVENFPPYEVAMYELSETDRERGMEEYHKAVRSAHRYKMSDWKGYGHFDGEQIQPITRQSELPNFKTKIV